MDDRWCESFLRVEDAIRLLERAQDGLHLAHGNRAALLVAAQDVNRASFAVLGKRHLHVGLPPSSTEHRHTAFNQRGVTFIEQSICGRAIPPRDEPRAAALRVKDSPNAPQPNLISVSRLDRLDVVERHVRCGGELSLRPAHPKADQANDLSQPLVFAMHTGIIAGAA